MRPYRRGIIYDIATITLMAIALLAATINGGLGYGFSSTVIPVALLFYTNQVLNPAILLIEVVINLYMVILNLKMIPSILRRILPILIGGIPGILVGAALLSSVHPDWTKLVTFSILLPLILLQAGGIRRPIQSEKVAGFFFGGGIGFFYAITTVAGPPLAVMFSNQGFVKKEFRAAMSVIRLFLSGLAIVVYHSFGLYHTDSTGVLMKMIPGVIIGIPLGAYVIRHVNAETFRRICMSFDAWLVGFGLSHVVMKLSLLKSPYAYGIWMIVIMIDSVLLYKYFAHAAGATPAGGATLPEALPPARGSEWPGHVIADGNIAGVAVQETGFGARHDSNGPTAPNGGCYPPGAGAP